MRFAMFVVRAMFTFYYVLFYILKHSLKFIKNHWHGPEAEKQDRARGAVGAHAGLISRGALTKQSPSAEAYWDSKDSI